MTNVTIIDDHKVLLDGLVHLINQSENIRVADTGYTIADCRTLLARQQPDVLVLDVGLPDGDGCEFCVELLQTYPSLKILMLTTYSEIAVITRALENGALGYMLKNSSAEEVLEGIRTVASGEQFMGNTIERIYQKKKLTQVRLTRRESELLQHIVSGISNAEIADRMCLAEQTIKGYRRNLVVKLQVRNTAQLVRRAIEDKLV